ncbi:MAG: hypothetical protein GVY16_07655 [Planctomycetes bacterium]|jgi:hypothetical protein|nr:hypothetical protein [Phycisphaerae bacterium]NBB95602.1 hypothetical protein [Planctomycetota bacterium]
MPAEMTTTCWRGLTIGHPADWELSRASGLDEPKRCSFSDRRSERLDVRWRPLKAVPNLDHMIERYRDKAPKGRDDIRLELLDDLPEPWSGIMQTGSDAQVVHAGRFFADERILVEVTVAWPKRRDTNLERELLRSIHPRDPEASAVYWRAMGMEITLPPSYELVEHTSRVGKVHWVFEQDARHGGTLTFDRYALTDTWLRAAVRDWLDTEVTTGRVVDRSTKQMNGHMAERLLSRSWHGTLSALRGISTLRLDLAWKCPTDTRLYHVFFRRPAQGEELPLPEQFYVQCCQPTAVGLGANA